MLLITELTVPAGLSPGEDAVIGLQASWLVCKDVCIPQTADLELAVPVANEGRKSPVSAP